MRGLKSQENVKFNRFWDFVQSEASKNGKVFFCFAGEGRNFSLADMEGENMSGWLIPEELSNEFEKQWEKTSGLDEWVDYFVWVTWEIVNNSLEIRFENDF